MGDCRIRVDIAKELMSIGSQQVEPKNDGSTITFTHTCSADTTIRELCETIKELWILLNSSKIPIGLWDCTYYPPKDISSWPLLEYPDVTGPKSKTLKDAGFFPSGSLLVLPKGLRPDEFSSVDYDDVQYNKKMESTTNSGNSAPVLLAVDGKDVQSTSRPLPSQVFQAVTTRFDHEKTNRDKDEEEDEKRQIRRQNQEQRQQILRQRAKRLEDRIARLEATEAKSAKNKNVSDQVRKMLVKSRATGTDKLKMQDRIYFQCIIDHAKDDDRDGENNDDNDEGSSTTITKDYRYFSPQDTIARIASSFSPPSQGLIAQVLIFRTNAIDDGRCGTSNNYWRLPPMMRVYEAMAQNILTDQVDTLIIRWSQETEELFPSIVDDTIPTAAETCQTSRNTTSVSEVESMELEQQEQTPQQSQIQSPNTDGLLLDEILANSIRLMDEANTKGKKPKKQSAATLKIRNMQMKSKAQGDKKRIPKVEDRFFMEVVTVEDDGETNASFQFLARKDPMERILQNVASGSASSGWEFLLPGPEDGKFSVVSNTSCILDKMEEDGIFKCFDRLILRKR